MNINEKGLGEESGVNVDMLEGDLATQAAADFLNNIQSGINMPLYDPDQDVVTFVAKEKDNPVGLFMAVRQNDTLHGSMVVVAPAHRKKGVTKRLLETAQQSGVKAIELTVFPLEEPEQHGKDFPQGEAAIKRVYEGLGFELVQSDRSRTVVWRRPE